jgi:hypothetical protein
MVLADHVSLPQRNPQRGLCKTEPQEVLPYLALTFSTLLSSQETDSHQKVYPYGAPPEQPLQLTRSARLVKLTGLTCSFRVPNRLRPLSRPATPVV